MFNECIARHDRQALPDDDNPIRASAVCATFPPVFFFYQEIEEHHEFFFFYWVDCPFPSNTTHALPFIPLHSIQYSQENRTKKNRKKEASRGEARRAHTRRGRKHVAHEQPGGKHKRGGQDIKKTTNREFKISPPSNERAAGSESHRTASSSESLPRI